MQWKSSLAGCVAAVAIVSFGAHAVEKVIPTKHTVHKHDEQPADQRLESQVKAALFASIGDDARQVGIEAHDGFVLLSGAVRTETLRGRAEQVAGRVLGVKSVDNAISVRRAG